MIYEHGMVMFLNYMKPAYFNKNWFKAFALVWEIVDLKTSTLGSRKVVWVVPCENYVVYHI